MIGCPKTIDGDLKSDKVEISFGFDTACKTYSNLIGNIALDGLSSKKYHHFVRLMGRSASHITLECALQTCPNLTLIGEEVSALHQTLADVTKQVCDMVCERWRQGKDYSVVVVPEGLIEFVPEMNTLIGELNDLLARGAEPHSIESHLSHASRAVFAFLPDAIRTQLLLERDPHGNVQVSRIETERLLIMLASTELAKRKAAGLYGGSFKALGHFFGYEGRSCLPSAFDSEYCYALGHAAATLVAAEVTGYMASVRNVAGPVSTWTAGGLPLTSLMDMEKRLGKLKPVIRKALVDLDARPFKIFAAVRDAWRLTDSYRNPGPIQFGGRARDAKTFVLLYERGAPVSSVHDPNNHHNNTTNNNNNNNSNSNNKHDHVFLPTHRDPARYSELEAERAAATVELPSLLAGPLRWVPSEEAHSSGESTLHHLYPLVSREVPLVAVAADEPTAARPLRIAVAFMGRQCSGAHDAVAGMLRRLQRPEHAGSQLFGLLGGSKGLLAADGPHVLELTEERLRPFVHQGGFDLLGRTADYLRSDADVAAARRACDVLRLDALVLVGGSKTVPDALGLAERFRAGGAATSVLVVPASVNGDLNPEYVESTVGFDTAVRVYSELIGNIAADAASAKKYYYFIRLMGRLTSHVTLECALTTHPNVTLIGEEVEARRQTLDQVTRRVADAICARADLGKNYGVVLVPEGIVNLFPEFGALLQALTDLGAKTEAEAMQRLPGWLAALYESLPVSLRLQLLMEREADGGVQLSQIDTEKLLIDKVEKELLARARAGAYTGKFSAINCFFGYEARCGLPSRFDSALAGTLGELCVALAAAGGHSGFAVVASNVSGPVQQWGAGAVPLARLVSFEARRDELRADLSVKAEHPVDLEGMSMRMLVSKRNEWLVKDALANPGPLQFHGPGSNARTFQARRRGRTTGERDALIEAAKRLVHAASDAHDYNMDESRDRTGRTATEGELRAYRGIVEHITSELAAKGSIHHHH